MKRSEMRDGILDSARTRITLRSIRATHLPSPSAHVRDAERIGREFLVLIFLDVLAMHGDRAGKADQLPASLVAVAAIDRVGEHALHHGLIEHRPEWTHRQAAVECDLRGGKPNQDFLTLLLGK